MKTGIKVGVIGLGSMGLSLLKGLKGLGDMGGMIGGLFGYDRNESKREQGMGGGGVKILRDEWEVWAGSDLCILAIKKKDILSFLSSTKGRGDILGGVDKKVYISVGAGLKMEDMEEVCGGGKKLVRMMPNLGVMVGEGVLGVVYGEFLEEGYRELIRRIFGGLGKIFEVKEEEMDGLTGVSGSGFAYIFLLIEGMADGGVRAGLRRGLALRLAVQTVLGASRLYEECGGHPGVLKDEVASAGGTTIEGIGVLERGGFRGLVMDAVFEAYQKSEGLGGEG